MSTCLKDITYYIQYAQSIAYEWMNVMFDGKDP